jgi:hypothetical protein
VLSLESRNSYYAFRYPGRRRARSEIGTESLLMHHAVAAAGPPCCASAGGVLARILNQSRVETNTGNPSLAQQEKDGSATLDG